MLSLTVAATMIKGDANPRSFAEPPRPSSVVRSNPIEELAEGYRPERIQQPKEEDRLPPGDPTQVFARLFDPTRNSVRSLFVLDEGSRRRNLRPGEEESSPLSLTPIEQRRAADQERFTKLNDDARDASEETRADSARERVLPSFGPDRLVIARLSSTRESGPTFSIDSWSANRANPLSERLSQLRKGQVPGMMDTDEMIGRDEIRRPGFDSTMRMRAEAEAMRNGNLERFAAGAYGSERSYQSELRRFEYDSSSGFQRRSMGYTSPYATGRAGASTMPSMGYRRLGN